MSKRSRLTVFHCLAFSILLLLVGFLGLVVRAFVTSGAENYILVAAAVLAATLTAYFSLRRPVTVAADVPAISVASRRLAPQVIDRRRQSLQGQVRYTVALERRGKQFIAPLDAPR